MYELLNTDVNIIIKFNMIKYLYTLVYSIIDNLTRACSSGVLISYCLVWRSHFQGIIQRSMWYQWKFICMISQQLTSKYENTKWWIGCTWMERKLHSTLYPFAPCHVLLSTIIIILSNKICNEIAHYHMISTFITHKSISLYKNTTQHNTTTKNINNIIHSIYMQYPVDCNSGLAQLVNCLFNEGTV